MTCWDMRNKIKKILFLFIVILIVKQTPAHEAMEGDILASLGSTVNQVIPRSGALFNDKDSPIGFALLVEADTRKNFGIEFGIFSNQYQYYREGDDYKASEKIKRVHIPIMFRYWFFPFFSWAAGPYASYRTGEATTLFLEGQWQDRLTSANDLAEHGVETSIMFDVPINKEFFITADVRYSYSLTPRESEYREMKSFTLALKYLIQRNPEQEKK